MRQEDPEPFRIWVDTGGTFTDGLAVAPDGTESRVKILSTSALRGTLLEQRARARYRIRESWSAVPGLIRGMRLQLLGQEHPECFVRLYDPAACEIELTEPLAAATASGAPFELLSDEEAPILVARLLTG